MPSNVLWPHMLPTDQQGRDDRCAVSAKGVRVRFANGRELLCGTSGLWNVNLGYGNEAIAQACAAALRDASYLSVYQWENSYARDAARAIAEVCGPEHYARVLFSTSGGAANDLSMKLVRQFHVLNGEPRRRAIVALTDGWHGLTFGSFALTGKNLGQNMYGIDRRMVAHVPPNEPEDLRALMTQHAGEVAAVVVEPVIGEGATPLTDAYLDELFELRRQHGFLVVADEVATGFGRTGSMFASDRWRERPDILITSKGLTNGTNAAAAVAVSDRVARVFADGRALFGHGETQAGTPLACAAILATIDEFDRLDAVASAARLSKLLDLELGRLVEDDPLISATTGLGCFRSVRLASADGAEARADDTAAVIEAIREAGAIVHHAPGGFQILPALVYTEDNLAELMSCIRAGLDTFRDRAR